METLKKGVRNMKRLFGVLMTVLLFIPWSGRAEQNPASSYTAEANRSWFELLDFSDEREKENALRGLIEAPEELVIIREDGQTAWDLRDFDFVREAEAPDTVNPSLWRNTQLNAYQTV